MGAIDTLYQRWQEVDVIGVARRVLVWVEGCTQRSRSRKALLELTEDQLKDIGISAADAYREGIRLPWDEGSNIRR